jgi:Zn ribbon nucleic-acid-binding protein
MKRHKSARVPKSKCLACGVRMDRATNMFDGHWKPSPGDFTICLKCGHLMIFADDLRVRELTTAQIVQVAGDKRVLLLQRVRAEVMKEKSNQEGNHEGQHRSERSQGS